jgi:hypothetical protein
MAKRTESHPSGDDRVSKHVEPPLPKTSGGRLPVSSPPSEALALFQRGMEALQRHAYREASTAFDAVVMGFPQERGLLDRAKVYLDLCARECARRPPAPTTIEERLTAATAALNNDDDSAAEELARSVLGDDPKHDLALYLLAAVFARRRSIADALDFLARAISLSPEASTQARTDDDFASLHDEDAFWTLTNPPIVPAGPRHRRARG